MSEKKDALVLLYKDTYAEIKKKEILLEGKMTIRDIVDKFLRIGLGLAPVDRFAQEMLRKLLKQSLTTESKKYINKLYMHLGTIQQAAEISRREMRRIPQDWKENYSWEDVSI